MHKRVYIDFEMYLKIIQQAANNNGEVIFEAMGASPFGLVMNAEYAKKECVRWKNAIDFYNKTDEI